MTAALDWDMDTDGAQRATRVVALAALDGATNAYDRIRRRDPDSVHNFRVALRRLRAWIRLYRPSLDDSLRKSTRRKLGTIASATREVRDLDVQIAWLRAERDALGHSRLEAASWILVQLKHDRKRAWKKLRKTLRRNFTGTERRLERELSHYVTCFDVRNGPHTTSMRTISAEVVDDQAVALADAFDRIRSADDATRVHRARIEARRARYVLEPLLPQSPELAPTVDTLTRFQNVVGELRDAQLLAHRVSREITSVVAERTAIVASELVYGPTGGADFTRVTAETPFDASLSLLFARLHDRISAAERAVTASLSNDVPGRLVRDLENCAKRIGAAR